MSERREIRCPECGAPLPAVAAHSVAVCAQCGTASEPAPKQPNTIVQTVVVERVVVRGDQPTLPCPRCRVGLTKVRVNDIDVHGCGVCGGIWLDNEGSHAITQRHDPQLEVLAARAERASVLSGTQPSNAAIDCPLCNKPMRPVQARGIALDICGAHGTWFDAGELRRLIVAIHMRDDDPLKPIAATMEQRIAAAAMTPVAAKDPWYVFSDPTSQKVADGAIGLLGIAAAGALGALAKK